MKNLKNVRYATTVVAACAALGLATESQAQTVTVDTDVTIQNTLTLAVAENLDYGVIVAISAAANTASIPVNTAGVIGPATTTGGLAYMAIVDSANAQAAQVTVEDGANAANINVTINNVVDPFLGVNALTLDLFRTAWNGAAPAAQVINTPFVVSFNSGFNGGVNTLDIGASLTTQTAVATYPDGAYDGGFDVVFSY